MWHCGSSLLHWHPNRVPGHDGDLAAEAAVVTAICLMCQKQEQQLQAYTHHSRAILDMGAQQAEDHAARCSPVPWRPPSGSRVRPTAGFPSLAQNPFLPRRTNPHGAYQSDPASASVPGLPRRAPQMQRPECGRCGRPECPMMEVEQAEEVVAASASAPGPEGRYQIPVKIQNNPPPVSSRGPSGWVPWVRIGCIHGDLHDDPLMT